jgi:hypothetical protein
MITGAVLVIAGLKAPHRPRIPKFAAEESCW